jgi:hypothetical protein
MVTFLFYFCLFDMECPKSVFLNFEILTFLRIIWGFFQKNFKLTIIFIFYLFHECVQLDQLGPTGRKKYIFYISILRTIWTDSPCCYVVKNRFVVLRCFCNIRWSILIDFCALSTKLRIRQIFWKEIQDGGDIWVGSENCFLLSIFQKWEFPKKIFYVLLRINIQKNYGRTFFDKTQNGGVNQDGGFW